MKRLFIFVGIIIGWFIGHKKNQHPIPIKGAVTIITGGASGIGKATAHCFARHQAHIIIVDLKQQLTESLQNEFSTYQTPVQFIACDITNAEQREHLLETLFEQHGQIDILINSAGISKGGAFSELSPQSIDRLLNVNLSATLHLTQAILSPMLYQNHGHIVNVSSINALMPPPGEAVYSATKAGLNAFTDALRRELSSTHIHVSLVLPALTDTAILNDVSHSELQKNGLLLPGMQVDKAENVAEAILSTVRFNKREVICGGNRIEWLVFLSKLRPAGMDWAFKYIINRKQFMNTLQKLGDKD